MQSVLTFKLLEFLSSPVSHSLAKGFVPFLRGFGWALEKKGGGGFYFW